MTTPPTVRRLLRAPLFSLTVVLSLALAIGANTTVFTWLQNLVFNPYPAVRDVDRLVALNTLAPDGEDSPMAWPVFGEWRQAATGLDGMAAWMPARVAARPPTAERVEPAWAMLVSGEYFDVLGITISRGRGFRRDEEESRTPVAVLTDSYWRKRFAADPGAVGRSFRVGDVDLTIIGIAPAGFAGTYVGVVMDFWVPLTLHQSLGVTRGSLDDRRVRWLQGFGRRREGVSLAAIKVELDRLARAESEAAGDRPALGALVRLPREQFLGDLVFPLFAAMLAVTGVILLAACANVANLMLARAATRARELAVRSALGAGRGRLLRQLLAESALLALLGGAAGLALAWAVKGAFIAFVPPTAFQIGTPMPINLSIVAYAGGVSGLTVLLFGLIPALRATRLSPSVVLKEESGIRGSWGPLRSGLIISQAALSVVSLVLAGLFLRSLGAASRVPLGFEAPAEVMLAATELRLGGIPDTLGPVLLDQLLERAAALPGVQSASAASMVPLGFGGFRRADTRIEAYQPAPDESMAIRRVSVAPDYFRTMRIPMHSGREFRTQDRAGTLPVAIVSRAFADRYWSGRDPLGRRLDQGTGWLTVVGVAGDIKVQALDDANLPIVYVPLHQTAPVAFTLHVRARSGTAAVEPALRRMFRDIHPDLPVLEVRTLAEHAGAATFVQRLGAGALAAFGGLALLLSGVGVFGVMAYSVNQRRREMGVRLALGGSPATLRRAVLRQALRLTAGGLLLGTVLALGMASLVRAQLLGVGVADPVTYFVVGVGLLTVSAAAAWVPALRASGVSPLVALREQ